MSLPEPSYSRVLKHSRNTQIQYYLREDGLWDIDAHFIDVKPFDLDVSRFIIPANKPIHDFVVRITVDARATIADVLIIFDHVPFEGICEAIGKCYKRLIGLPLMTGFRQAVKERFSGVNGCIHLNELIGLLPAAAMQVFIFGENETRQKADINMADSKPLHLDKCHALRTDGSVVAEFYPRWAVIPVDKKE